MILRDKDKVRVIDLACKTLSGSFEIWAFGSRLTGEAHEGSDLDLVIKSDDEISWHEFARYKEALKHSNIPILVQVMDWNTIPKSFQENILANYVVLYSSEKVKTSAQSTFE